MSVEKRITMRSFVDGATLRDAILPVSSGKPRSMRKDARAFFEGSIRPQWLYDAVHAIQRRAYPRGLESTRHILRGVEPESRLERRLARALIARLRRDHAANTAEGMEQSPIPELFVEAQAFEAVAEAAEHLLRTQHKNPWTVDRIARRVGRNRTDLEIAFRHYYMRSLHEYLIVCRVDAAKRILRRCAWRIEEIAKEVGFRSRTSLYEHFRRLVGMAPEQYRRGWKYVAPSPDVLELLDRLKPR